MDQKLFAAPGFVGTTWHSWAAGHCWGSTPQNCQVPRGIQFLSYILGSENCQVGIEKYYICEQHVSIYGILTRQQYRNELYHSMIYQSFQPCIACIPHKPSTTLVPTSVFYEWIRTLSVGKIGRLQASNGWCTGSSIWARDHTPDSQQKSNQLRRSWRPWSAFPVSRSRFHFIHKRISFRLLIIQAIQGWLLKSKSNNLRCGNRGCLLLPVAACTPLRSGLTFWDFIPTPLPRSHALLFTTSGDATQLKWQRLNWTLEMECTMILDVSWMFLHVPSTSTQSLRFIWNFILFLSIPIYSYLFLKRFPGRASGPPPLWLRRTASEDQLAPGPGRKNLKCFKGTGAWVILGY